MSERIIIGTRGSTLALWQAHAVGDAITKANPGVAVEYRIITTTGDVIVDKPLEQIGSVGLFTKELERALQAGDIDLCAHSVKDMASELPDGFSLLGCLPRGDVRDVLVCGPRMHAASLSEVPAGARLGTGSLRRTAQLRALFPRICPTSIRGNVDTRLAKADGDEYDGVILAAAGVERIGATKRISAYIPVDLMVPAAGQGAVGIEARTDDERVERICQAINHAPTMRCVAAERAVLSALEGGCQVPVGVYARHDEDALLFDAVVCAVDGGSMARVSRRFGADADLLEAACEVVTELNEKGAGEILSKIRATGGVR